MSIEDVLVGEDLIGSILRDLSSLCGDPSRRSSSPLLPSAVHEQGSDWPFALVLLDRIPVSDLSLLHFEKCLERPSRSDKSLEVHSSEPSSSLRGGAVLDLSSIVREQKILLCQRRQSLFDNHRLQPSYLLYGPVDDQPLSQPSACLEMVLESALPPSSAQRDRQENRPAGLWVLAGPSTDQPLRIALARFMGREESRRPGRVRGSSDLPLVSSGLRLGVQYGVLAVAGPFGEDEWN